MAIATLNDLVFSYPGQNLPYNKIFTNGTTTVAGWQNLWRLYHGTPGPNATAPTTGTWQIPTSSTQGAVPFTNPGGGALSYLTRFTANASMAGMATLYDRLGHVAITTLTATPQTLTTTPLTRPDANGADVELWWETTALGSTTVTATCSYTNQAGSSGKTTGSVSLLSSITGNINGMVPFPLAAGDTGVRTVESIVASGTSSGTTGQLVLLRRIADIPLPYVYGDNASGPFDTGMPQIYDSACLAMMYYTSAAAGSFLIYGSLQIVQV